MRVAVPPLTWPAAPVYDGALKLLFIAPAFVMLGAVVQSQPDIAPASPPTINRDENQRIAQYLEVVRAGESLFRYPVTADRLRATASIWTAQFREGSLKPLLPQTWNEQITDGAKGEIFSMANMLGSRLSVEMGVAASKRSYFDAAQDGVLSATVVEPLKYSDYTSLAIVGLHQLKVLGDMRALVPHLTREQRQEVKAGISCVAPESNVYGQVVQTQEALKSVKNRETRIMRLAVQDMPGAEAVNLRTVGDISIMKAAGDRMESELQDAFKELQRTLDEP